MYRLALLFAAAHCLPAQVVIIGAGVSGLSAALEASRAGSAVTVIDMSTVGGGHAILSNGAVCIVGTPLQEMNGITDTVALAQSDFLSRGREADRAWVESYTENSRVWLYQWLTDLGVDFRALARPPGNSVPRLHLARDKGWGLAGPLLRECFRRPNISFSWATRAEKLVLRAGAVLGVDVRDLRTGRKRTIGADAVIVATGGFQRPTRILLGAAHTATGSGLELLRNSGGTLTRMDHQWNYVLGLPDPRDPARQRGLAAFTLDRARMVQYCSAAMGFRRQVTVRRDDSRYGTGENQPEALLCRQAVL